MQLLVSMCLLEGITLTLRTVPSYPRLVLLLSSPLPFPSTNRCPRMITNQESIIRVKCKQNNIVFVFVVIVDITIFFIICSDVATSDNVLNDNDHTSNSPGRSAPPTNGSWQDPDFLYTKAPLAKERRVLIKNVR